MKIVNFVGYSGSGKTTLIEKLIPIFCAQGLRVAAIKNAHHNFDMDKPGKDSYRYRRAGASQVIVRNAERWAMFSEMPQGAPHLSELIAHLDPADLIVVEGFKSEDSDALRLEVFREIGRGEPPICQSDESICAVVSDKAREAFSALPVLDINSPEKVAAWITEKLQIKGIEKC